MEDGAPLTIPSKPLLTRLLLRVTIYYLALGGVLAGLAITVPEFLDLAPIGGLFSLGGHPDAAIIAQRILPDPVFTLPDETCF